MFKQGDRVRKALPQITTKRGDLLDFGDILGVVDKVQPNGVLLVRWDDGPLISPEHPSKLRPE